MPQLGPVSWVLVSFFWLWWLFLLVWSFDGVGVLQCMSCLV
uniref:ATP synthase F0 subunit 8 n=1 Tax=Quadrula quadrula TaxID=52372 RepID=D2DW01_QUAQU|nr:ATP synthase F0 subunit 8 [Quadrula quadrula]